VLEQVHKREQDQRTHQPQPEVAQEGQQEAAVDDGHQRAPVVPS
jgi:hypothetical protein